MIATEFKTPTATIRIHDEYFETTLDSCICKLSHIVSESYKRRQILSNPAAELNKAVKKFEV